MLVLCQVHEFNSSGYLDGFSGKKWLWSIKKFSSFQLIREMQFKTILRFYLIPLRMVQVGQTTKSKCLKGSEEKGTVIHCWGTITTRSSDSGNPLWRILTKLKYVYHRTQLQHSWHMSMSKGINILLHSNLPSHYHCCHYSLNMGNGNSPVSLKWWIV